MNVFSPVYETYQFIELVQVHGAVWMILAAYIEYKVKALAYKRLYKVRLRQNTNRIYEL